MNKINRMNKINKVKVRRNRTKINTKYFTLILPPEELEKKLMKKRRKLKWHSQNI